MKTNPLHAILKLVMIVLVQSSFSTRIIAQNTIKYTPLQSYNPGDDVSDLASFDSFFSQSKIVGMGESTHGTHEFFKNRHRVLKYLVEKHGFNVFFLEADYGNCLRVNRYIHGENDNLEEVVRSIGLWPWITEEMKELIQWMREYNSLVSSTNQLEFVGCDMQMLSSTLSEIDRLIDKYDSSYKTSTTYPPITIDEFFDLSEEELTNIYHLDLVVKKNLLNSLDFNATDRYTYQTLIRHLEQIIAFKEKREIQSYRDVKMGENILYHLGNKTSVKGFFWAHNAHIVNFNFPHKKEKKAFITTGGVLKKELGEKYFIIGQDFDQGTFNAFYIPDYDHNKKVDLKDISNYKLGPVHIGLNEVELGSHFRDIPDSILYVIPSELEKEETLLYLHNIGTTYIPPKNKMHPSAMAVGNNNYDIIMFINNTTATRLIKKD